MILFSYRREHFINFKYKIRMYHSNWSHSTIFIKRVPHSIQHLHTLLAVVPGEREDSTRNHCKQLFSTVPNSG